jgi:hypothetical protein
LKELEQLEMGCCCSFSDRSIARAGLKKGHIERWSMEACTLDQYLWFPDRTNVYLLWQRVRLLAAETDCPKQGVDKK